MNFTDQIILDPRKRSYSIQKETQDIYLVQLVNPEHLAIKSLKFNIPFQHTCSIMVNYLDKSPSSYYQRTAEQKEEWEILELNMVSMLSGIEKIRIEYSGKKVDYYVAKKLCWEVVYSKYEE